MLIQNAEGSFDDFGGWQEGSETTTALKLASAPMTVTEFSKSKNTLPEGARLQDVRRFWLVPGASPLTAGEKKGDVIVHEGTRYRVIEQQPWGPFSEVRGVRQEQLNA